MWTCTCDEFAFWRFSHHQLLVRIYYTCIVLCGVIFISNKATKCTLMWRNIIMPMSSLPPPSSDWTLSSMHGSLTQFTRSSSMQTAKGKSAQIKNIDLNWILPSYGFFPAASSNLFWYRRLAFSEASQHRLTLLCLLTACRTEVPLMKKRGAEDNVRFSLLYGLYWLGVKRALYWTISKQTTL